MISVVIVTFNESHSLKKCLQNISRFADEIVVVDLGSSDNTVTIAQMFGARVVFHPFVQYVELVRNFAIDQCRGSWILILDPDEKVPRSLQNYMRVFSQRSQKGALNIPRANIFFGTWIVHSNFWPDRQVRFFSKGVVEWQTRIHSYPKTSIPPLKVPQHFELSLLHTSYPTFSSFLSKQKRYARLRAQERYDSGESARADILLLNLCREFLARFIKHGGWHGGKHGLYLLFGILYYHWMTEYVLWQLQKHASEHHITI